MMAKSAVGKEGPDVIMVDGRHYKRSDVSEQALVQITNLHFADAQLQVLNNRIALIETARAAYVKVLAQQLPDKTAPGNRKKDVITVDGDRYRLEDFSAPARAQLANIQFADSELQTLHGELAVAQTARTRYGNVLAEELKGVTPLKPR